MPLTKDFLRLEACFPLKQEVKLSLRLLHCGCSHACACACMRVNEQCLWPFSLLFGDIKCKWVWQALKISQISALLLLLWYSPPLLPLYVLGLCGQKKNLWSMRMPLIISVFRPTSYSLFITAWNLPSLSFSCLFMCSNHLDTGKMSVLRNVARHGLTHWLTCPDAHSHTKSAGLFPLL